jgi:ATP-dependent DNA helicase RecG
VQKNGAEKTAIQEQNILALIKNKNTISRKSIAKQLGVGTTTVYRYIESLKRKGIIERIGGDKGGYWKIKQ